MRTKKATPRMRNVLAKSIVEMRKVTRGAVIKADKPKPMTVKPNARPLLSGNHLPTTAIGGLYAKPHPVPATSPNATIVIQSAELGAKAIA